MSAQQQHRQHPLRLVRRDNGLCDLVDVVTHTIVAFSVDEDFGRWVETLTGDAFPFATADEALDAATVACESGQLEEAEQLTDEFRARRQRRAEALAAELRTIALAGVGR